MTPYNKLFLAIDEADRSQLKDLEKRVLDEKDITENERYLLEMQIEDRRKK